MLRQNFLVNLPRFSIAEPLVALGHPEQCLRRERAIVIRAATICRYSPMAPFKSPSTVALCLAAANCLSAAAVPCDAAPSAICGGQRRYEYEKKSSSHGLAPRRQHYVCRFRRAPRIRSVLRQLFALQPLPETPHIPQVAWFRRVRFEFSPQAADVIVDHAIGNELFAPRPLR